MMRVAAFGRLTGEDIGRLVDIGNRRHATELHDGRTCNVCCSRDDCVHVANGFCPLECNDFIIDTREVQFLTSC